jgi:O-antigen/teichoic acid export membrane protein
MTEVIREEEHVEHESARRHIRGSTLLLAGRAISLSVNFATQVLTVRYLSKLEYGALAYGLTLAALATNFNALSLDRTLSRFLPIYEERRDLRKLSGALVLAFGTIATLGLAIVVVAWSTRSLYSGRLVTDPLAVALLLILIVLAPLGALDRLLEQLLAVFAGARSIFFRRHILTPAVRFSTILAVILAHGSVYGVALAHLAAGILGVLLYGIFLRNILAKQGLLGSIRIRTASLPVREIYAYAFPLLTADVAVMLRLSLVVLFLGYFHASDTVAEVRAVLPVAQLNEVVYTNFSFLFIPIASRLFAQNRNRQLAELYVQTSVWVTVMTFPIFAATFFLANPLAVLFFGQRYANSGPILAMLAFASYFGASVGFNVKTLRVYGNVRYAMIGDVIATLFAVVSGLLLIPRYGAIGGAIAFCASTIVHGLLNQYGLWLATGISPFVPASNRVNLAVVVATLGLLLLKQLWPPSLLLGIPVVALTSFLLVRLVRDSLRLKAMFPEIQRIPLARFLVERSRRKAEFTGARNG